MINRWLPLKGKEVPLNEEKSPFPADEFQSVTRSVFSKWLILPLLFQVFI